MIKFFETVFAAGVELEPLRGAIADAIAADDFKIDDLAARFIVIDGSGGVGWDQLKFDVVAPTVPYRWYDKESKEDFPDNRYSWTGRRELAVGRIRKPPQAASPQP